MSYLFIFDDLAAAYGSEPGEDEFQILTPCNGIQFTHKQHVFWRLDLCMRQVTYNFQR